jgi:Leucine-rich repeat (LRR) protein
LYNNQITDITPLSNLTKLKTLDLLNNQITDITPLNNLNKKIKIKISAFPIIYSRNPTHPLVKSYTLETFDKDLQKQLLNDLNITKNFKEGNINFIL